MFHSFFKSVPLALFAMAVFSVSLPRGAAAGGGPVDALDLTGVWAGGFSCKGLDGDGELIKPKGAFLALILVSEDGEAAIAFEPGILRGAPRLPPLPTGLCGLSITRAGKPGSGSATFGSASAAATLVYDPSFPIQAMHFHTAKTFTTNAKGVSGKLVGTAIGLPYLFGESVACKVKFARIDLTDPSGDVDPILLSECGFLGGP